MALEITLHFSQSWHRKLFLQRLLVNCMEGNGWHKHAHLSSLWTGAPYFPFASALSVQVWHLSKSHSSIKNECDRVLALIKTGVCNKADWISIPPHGSLFVKGMKKSFLSVCKPSTFTYLVHTSQVSTAETKCWCMDRVLLFLHCVVLILCDFSQSSPQINLDGKVTVTLQINQPPINIPVKLQQAGLIRYPWPYYMPETAVSRFYGFTPTTSARSFVWTR